ncbi:MAG: hypothetical protein A2Y12_00090 [Planctomycetes bacterium GWF2_42_9]|nr:MAG: hypothetical protein A2Y12_00090 [Planctomycetes bacterium GWF2_42_9]
MANSSAIKAGAAYVEIFADKSKLMRGLRAAETDIKKWGKSISSFGAKMMGVGTAILTPLIGAAKYFSTFGDNIAKMSKRTGVSVESLSALGFAAEQSGSNIETLEKGIRKMQQSILDSNMGLKTTTDIFAMLGLNASSFSGLKPEEQFRLLADRLSQIQDPSQRAAIAMKLLGKSGTALLPMLEKGAAGLDELMEEAKRLGLVLSSEDAASAEELNDALNRMWRTIKMSFANIGAAIAPIITDLSNKIAVIVGKISNWIKENRGLVRMVLYLAASLVAAGGAFVAFGYAMIFVSKAIAVIRTGFSAIRTALMFLMSPIGMIITAVTALTGVFLYFTGYGGQLLNWLGGCFNTLRTDATNAIGGITAALANGDIGTAAKIAFLFLKMEWLRAKEWMLGYWHSIKLFIAEIWYALVYSIAVAWYATVYGIEVAFAETAAFIQRTWARAVALLKTAWVDCVQFFQSIWVTFKEWWGNTIDWVAKKLMRVWIWWKKITDSKFDAAAAEKELQESFSKDKQDRQDASDSKLLQIDKEADTKRAAIDKEKEDSLNEIESRRAKRREQSKKEFDSGLGAANQYVENGLQNIIEENKKASQETAAELAKTKNEFNAAVAKVKEPAAPTAKALTAPKKDWQASGLDKASIAGTFSAFGLGQMGAGGVMQKIADASMRTAAATEEIADNTADGGAEFGE